MKKEKKHGKKERRHSSQNLKIGTRVTISTAAAIILPLLIVAIFGSVFLYSMSSHFNISTVTANSYSTLNQIQWNQTVASIGDELESSDSDSEKLQKIEEFVAPLEKLGAMTYIEYNGSRFFATDNPTKIVSTAKSIAGVDSAKNSNYFGENGMAIVSHASYKQENDFTILITSKKYSVSNATSKSNYKNISSQFFGMAGIILLCVTAIFVISIILLSFITSRTITKPLKQLSDGADEIAGGNLDYVIDYKSTNEIGTTVNAFNKMAKRLKKSIDSRERIAESRKQVINGVAHDLRTPLTSIKGYVEGLRDGIASTPEMQKRYLDTIYLSALDMEKLLDDLLSLSRLESGHIDIQPERTNIVLFLEDYAAETSFQLKKEDFDFIYEKPKEDEIFVMLDCDRFYRVLQNIVSNSVKYSKKNIRGQITMSLQNYKNSAIISLRDNGIGIDRENLPKIFDTFFRADLARTRVREGSGIGLAVCKQIVELHGGQIWASSEPDEGTTIFISLKKITEGSDEQKNSDS